MIHLAKIGFGVLLTLIGLVGGRFLAQSPNADEGGHVHAPTPDGMCACESAALGPCAAPGTPRMLSPQTLKNLGVVIAPVQRREDFARTQKVQAVVVDRPLNKRPVVAPFGGIVTGVFVRTGEVVKAGADLVAIARDPIPRPKPELTASLLEPVAETVHEATRTLRTELGQLEVTRRELERIRPFVENQTLPRKTAIDLEYEAARHEQSAEIARAELRNHGLDAETIADLAAGGTIPATAHLWRRVLQQNGLWNGRGEAIFATLPAAQRDLPWSVAAIGELAAAGLATEALAQLLAEVPHATQHFSEVAGLLLQGTPLATVRLLAKGGALEPQMTIRSPAAGLGDEPDDWDVEEIRVRVGQRVEAGGELVHLYDARRMWLEIQPVGQEMGYVARAIEQGDALLARPLVPDSGPPLDGVRLTRMAIQADAGQRGGLAHAVVKNVPLNCAAGVACRTWQLRNGLRYLVEVPIERFPNHFVLPAGAVTDRGPDRVVFIQEGDSFRAQPVHVKYADDQIAVIPDDGSLFDGDPVVQEGAFPLGLALQTDPAQNVADHGHSHQ